jgi:hypothetical protein
VKKYFLPEYFGSFGLKVIVFVEFSNIKKDGYLSALPSV